MSEDTLFQWRHIIYQSSSFIECIYNHLVVDKISDDKISALSKIEGLADDNFIEVQMKQFLFNPFQIPNDKS